MNKIPIKDFTLQQRELYEQHKGLYYRLLRWLTSLEGEFPTKRKFYNEQIPIVLKLFRIDYPEFYMKPPRMPKDLLKSLSNKHIRDKLRYNTFPVSGPVIKNLALKRWSQDLRNRHMRVAEQFKLTYIDEDLYMKLINRDDTEWVQVCQHGHKRSETLSEIENAQRKAYYKLYNYCRKHDLKPLKTKDTPFKRCRMKDNNIFGWLDRSSEIFVK
jgi:hypothetical protein